MKVALLGAAGGIGQALGLLLKSQMPAHSTLSLYDVAPVTPGIAVDLSHIPTAVTVTGYGGSDPTPALQDANIVIIAAGVARKPGMDRADLLDVNASIIRTLIQHIAKTCPQACIGIITNPVNSMVPIAAQVLRQAKVYNQRKLFGITTLDIIRANTFLAALKQQSPQQVAVPVIGGHSGITILPLLSHIKDIHLDQQQVATLTERIQHAGTEVVNAKAGNGSATLSMGYAAAHFTLALIEALQGQSGVETYAFVEAMDPKYSRFFAQALRLGREGITEYLAIGELSDFEQQALEGMLHTLQQEIAQGEQWIAHKSS